MIVSINIYLLITLTCTYVEMLFPPVLLEHEIPISHSLSSNSPLWLLWHPFFPPHCNDPTKNHNDISPRQCFLILYSPPAEIPSQTWLFLLSSQWNILQLYSHFLYPLSLFTFPLRPTSFWLLPPALHRNCSFQGCFFCVVKSHGQFFILVSFWTLIAFAQGGIHCFLLEVL